MRIVIFVTANRGGKAEGEEGRQDGKSYLLLVTESWLHMQVDHTENRNQSLPAGLCFFYLYGIDLILH